MLNYWHQDGAIGAGNKFYNNTVLGRPPNSALIALIDGQNVETFNNVFRTSASARVGGGPAFNIHHNIFFNTSGTVPAGNSTDDPRVVDPSGTTAASARIGAQSAAIDAAAPGAPAADFFGSKRQGRADLGAVEFVSGVGRRSPQVPTGLRVR